MNVVIVLPTYNERENIGALIDGLNAQRGLTPHALTVLVVDDNSPDGTQDVVRTLQGRYDNVRLLTGTKQGLGTAYTRGIDHALRELNADVVMHMDADFSHDPRMVPAILARIDQGADLVVGSRYVEGGALAPDWGTHRRVISRVANAGIRFIAGITQLRDCTSGYRAYRATVLRRVDLAGVPRGYAALAYLAYQSIMAGARAAEVPITFADRVKGTSKLRASDALELFFNAWWIRYDRRERFLRRASGGLSGIAVNLLVLALLVHAFGVPAIAASALAIEASVLFSYGWRLVWGHVLRKGNAPSISSLLTTHAWALPSFAITLATFVLLHAAGLAPVPSQAIAIVPAMVWNYFIGDRLVGLLGGEPARLVETAAPLQGEAPDVPR
jgi:dolichol-phosphate mannosyltransferase